MNSFQQLPADLQLADTPTAPRPIPKNRCGAIVVAAGSGTRFGTQKQFLHLSDDERLVDRAVSTAAAVADWVVVVLPSEVEWDGDAVYASCGGGFDRLGSVLKGLGHLPQEAELVLVHDAAHPLASVALARSLLDALDQNANSEAVGAVPVLEAVDVIKRTRDDGSLETVGRAGLGAAQVPMAFRRTDLVAAHAQRAADRSDPASAAVEDSTLLEALGHRLVAVPGEITNIHIVNEPSLRMARVLAEHVL